VHVTDVRARRPDGARTKQQLSAYRLWELLARLGLGYGRTQRAQRPLLTVGCVLINL
jgi:hypothetical protein